MTSPASAKPDIESRDCIKQLVDTFYDKIQRDDILGFIFNDVAAIDWQHHLPRMYDFWQTVLFRNGGFRGNPLTVHAALVQRTPMGKKQFDRWLTLFNETVDELFSGTNADHIKNCAADMAAVIHRKINNLPDPVSLMSQPPISGSYKYQSAP